MAKSLMRLAPGVALVAGVSAAAVGAGWLEERAVARAVLEPLVLAILIGMAVRTVWGASAAAQPGIEFVAKDLLELAVCLLGATMDVPRLFASGPALAVAIVLLVCCALVSGVLIGRAAGLSAKLAILVAVGNAVCGNSAIAAVAPVIGAEREDVAAAIALTGVLGVAVVLGLPLLIAPLSLSLYQYVLAGRAVYAVPQVLAASFAVSALSGQVATVVKLARVLMLGPVVVFFALRTTRVKLRVTDIVPPFVMGFVLLAALRSIGTIPDAAASLAKVVATWLTIGAMAGLGLSVDVRSVRQAGARVVLAVAGSLVTLLVLSIVAIRTLALWAGVT